MLRGGTITQAMHDAARDLGSTFAIACFDPIICMSLEHPRLGIPDPTTCRQYHRCVRRSRQPRRLMRVARRRPAVLDHQAAQTASLLQTEVAVSRSHGDPEHSRCRTWFVDLAQTNHRCWSVYSKSWPSTMSGCLASPILSSGDARHAAAYALRSPCDLESHGRGIGTGYFLDRYSFPSHVGRSAFL